MTTACVLVHSPEHVYAGHPEEPGRFAYLKQRIETYAQVEAVSALPATHDEIARVHHPRMITELESACRLGPGIIDYAPTYITTTSFTDALNAAGGTLACTRAVLNGEARNAFALVRPPGHHAEPAAAMGFCLFNNIAIAAQEALAHGLKRVLVMDFDAHHGNGTQAAFWHDDRLAYLSTHQEGIYPGSGWIEEAPHARKRIVNVPLPANAGDKCFEHLTGELITPMMAEFNPEMILVSAGYDAHWSDPLTALGLSAAGFYAISRRLVELAGEHCGGKIVFVLEGGYNPQNIANGVDAAFAALTGLDNAPDSNDTTPYREPDIAHRLAAVKRWHGFPNS